MLHKYLLAMYVTFLFFVYIDTPIVMYESFISVIYMFCHLFSVTIC